MSPTLLSRNQLPRFLKAAKAMLTPAQAAAARALVTDSADAAWQTRVLPPFPATDVCHDGAAPAAGKLPKFTWDWQPEPAAGTLMCMDARTQAQALAVFVAELAVGTGA